MLVSPFSPFSLSSEVTVTLLVQHTSLQGCPSSASYCFFLVVIYESIPKDTSWYKMTALELPIPPAFLPARKRDRDVAKGTCLLFIKEGSQELLHNTFTYISCLGHSHMVTPSCLYSSVQCRAKTKHFGRRGKRTGDHSQSLPFLGFPGSAFLPSLHFHIPNLLSGCHRFLNSIWSFIKTKWIFLCCDLLQVTWRVPSASSFLPNNLPAQPSWYHGDSSLRQHFFLLSFSYKKSSSNYSSQHSLRLTTYQFLSSFIYYSQFYSLFLIQSPAQPQEINVLNIHEGLKLGYMLTQLYYLALGLTIMQHCLFYFI